MPIICGDFDSAELRIAAYEAQDKPLLEAFAQGAKPHIETTRLLFGKEFDKRSPQYTFAKGFTYRMLYTLPGKVPTEGGQLRLYTVDITVDHLQGMVRKFDRAHPALLRWKQEVIGELHRTHKVRNVFGRYRDLSWGLLVWSQEVVEHVSQAALNFKIQTVIGTMMNRAFLRFDDEIEKLRSQGLRGYPVLQCHDELGAWTPDPGEVATIARLLNQCMVEPVQEMGGLSIPCELKVGPNWGSCKEYKL